MKEWIADRLQRDREAQNIYTPEDWHPARAAARLRALGHEAEAAEVEARYGTVAGDDMDPLNILIALENEAAP